MKSKPMNCTWSESCHCDLPNGVVKNKYCEKCKFYQFIDSGYGWCKAFPEPITIAWCKDVCFFYSSPDNVEITID